MVMDEIRVKVTRQDIERAWDTFGSDYEEDIPRFCALAQALMRLGYAAVEVEGSDRVYIGHDRYEAIDERPGGERLWRLIEDFDATLDVGDFAPVPEADEFVLRRCR